MKKFNKVLVFLLFFVLCLSGIISYSNTITTTSNKYKIANDKNDKTVSLRELAILASLVYEDVPNDNKYVYTENEKRDGCINENGELISNCFFKTYTDKKYKLKNTNNYFSYRYVEGMSQRRVDSFVSGLFMANVEEGEKYYFQDFASSDEFYLKNEDGTIDYASNSWSIFDYKSDSENNNFTNINFENTLSSITFKKNDNYVIAFRGTDFNDLGEWLFSDFAYAIDGSNKQAKKVYKYTQEVYEKILKENKDAKVYVTGHSLGAYLAQVAGAAIIDYETGKESAITRVPDNNMENINSYSDKYKIEDGWSNLVQVAYFNGMGVNGLLASSDFTSNIQNSLIYLATHRQDGLYADYNRYVNYSDNIQSSGRLVLYSMEGDPISEIGVHYGSIYKLEVAPEAVNNHKNKHSFTKDNLESIGKSFINNYNNITKEKIEENAKTIKKAIKNLGSNYNNNEDLASNITEILYSIISGEDKLINSVIPDIVSKEIYDNTGLMPVGSILDRIFNDVGAPFMNAKGLKGIMGIVELFNIGHETDSFACVVDSNGVDGTSGNGVALDKNIDLKISGNNIDCSNEKCFIKTSKPYSDISYNYNDGYIKFNNDDNDNYIKLTANVKNACGRYYTWFYKTDEGLFKNIIWNDENGNSKRYTKTNEIIIPKYVFDNLSDNINFEFKVQIGQSTTYREIEAVKGENGLLKYSERNKTTHHPSTNPVIEDSGYYGNSAEKIITLSVQKEEDIKIKFNTNGITSLSDSKIKCNNTICYSNSDYNLTDHYIKVYLEGENKKNITWEYFNSNENKWTKFITTSADTIPASVVNNNLKNNVSDIEVRALISGIPVTSEKITINFDKNKPVCRFSPSYFNFSFTKLKNSRNLNKVATLTCTDDNPFSSDIKITNDDLKIEKSIVSKKVFELTESSYSASYSSDNKTIKFYIPVKIIDNSGFENTLSLKDDVIKDFAGNSTTIKNNVRFKISN